MTEPTQDLLHRIKGLQQEFEGAVEEKEKAFRYKWLNGKAKFEEEVLLQHRKLKTRLPRYLLDSRFLAALTSPVIYFGIIPFAFLDLFLTVYQLVCFSAYGVPKVKRSDYIIFDRRRLAYLNLLEGLNCAYCSYGNGLCAYATEIVARTEQHWCPIKHARRIRSPHSRYSHFFEYGDAERYRKEIEEVRCDFSDVKKSSKS